MDESTAPSRFRGLHPVRWLREHPAVADQLLALLVTAVSVGVHLSGEQVGSQSVDPAWWTVPFVVASVYPVAWRRTHTYQVVVVVVLVQVVSAVIGIEGAGFIGVLIALYSLGAHRAGPARVRLLAGVAAVIAVLFIAGLIVDEVSVGDLVSSVTVLVTAYVVGDNFRRRRAAAEAMAERAERAERERELIAQQRVDAERARIARELHDVVAHSVSVMVIQAAAARRSLTSSPENAERALGAIEDTGRQTMNELRAILGVLRRQSPGDEAPAEARAPQPALDGLSRLLDVSEDLPVVLSVDGDVGQVPASVSMTGFRVVQEALTNVRRHAGTVDTVSVDVEVGPDRVVISVADDGRGAANDGGRADGRDDTGGYGIAGMNERVGAIGGSLRAGPRRGGGWLVEAVLPTRTSTTTPATAPAPPARATEVEPSRVDVGAPDAVDVGDASDAPDAAVTT